LGKIVDAPLDDGFANWQKGENGQIRAPSVIGVEGFFDADHAVFRLTVVRDTAHFAAIQAKSEQPDFVQLAFKTEMAEHFANTLATLLAKRSTAPRN
jgi:hypothetical protein